MSVLSAAEIRKYVTDHNLIEGFAERVKYPGMMSYGLGYAGYDLRMGNKLKRGRIHSGALDPVLVDAGFWMDYESTRPFTIAPAETILATTYEKINMPTSLIGIILGKSSYARCGIHVNATPIEPGWSGHVTLEITNQFSSSVILRPLEGIAQLLFLNIQGELPSGYEGAYQNQIAAPVLSTTGIEGIGNRG